MKGAKSQGEKRYGVKLQCIIAVTIASSAGSRNEIEPLP